MLKIFKKKEVTKKDSFDELCKVLKELMPEELKNIELKGSTKIETLG